MGERRKDTDWRVAAQSDGTYSYEASQLTVLMDIRDELKLLNGLLHCQNFIAIPQKLDAIRRNTAKPRSKKSAKKRVA